MTAPVAPTIDAKDTNNVDISNMGETRAQREDHAIRYDQQWLTSTLRPFLVAVLAGCLVIALIAFLRHAAPWLPIAYSGVMVAIGIGAALIGSISTTWLAQPDQRMKRSSGYRVAEFALLLGSARLATWLTVGNWPTADQFFTRPLDTLLDGYFIMSSFIVALSWILATSMTSDMLRMALQPDEIEAAKLRASREIDDMAPPNYTDRRAVLGGLVARWLVGGVILVMLTAAVRFGPAENGFFALTQQNIDPIVISAVVVYFLTGLILISQGQLAVLRARWTLEKVPSTANVLRNWPLYTFLVIVAIGFVAGLLPFGGTFWIAQVLYAIIWFAYSALLTIFQIVLGLFMVLLSFFTGEETEPIQAQPPEFAPPRFEAMPEPASQVPPWLGGSIFWLFTALLLGYAAYIYFSGKGANFQWLARFWQMLRERWAELFGQYQAWQLNSVRRKVADGDGEGSALGGGLFSWLRLRNLDPDQQVRYFYLSTLHRAERIGVPRRASETPSQYAPRLMQEVALRRMKQEAIDAENAADSPHDGEHTADQHTVAADEIAARPADTDDLEDEQTMQELTDAFLHVRYAGQRAPPEQIPYLKQMWEKVKKRLRRKVKRA